MCGILGLMLREGSPPGETLARLTAALAHRGPDGTGEVVRGPVALGHTRLAIIDLATGDQPLFDGEGRALVANGEIYNYLELRQELIRQRGEDRFTTHSDCEPPLFLYAKDGLAFAQSLRGMYAIALHDAAAGRLVLARDPFGIKPLYYAETAQGFAFASEAQALVRAGVVAPRVNAQARDELLNLQFTTGAETLFQGIRRLLPGETVAVEGAKVVDRLRRPALPQDGPAGWSEAEALERLDAALIDSVLVHQRADVPYGMFLSGGIDSSVVLALLARLNERPVQAFTAGFPGTTVADERAHARHLAEVVGAEHVEVEFGPDDFFALLPRIAAHMDDPAADYAILPSWKLAEVARRQVKVILSGEGGDELFGGYGRYRGAMRPWPFTKRMRARGILDGLGLLREEAPAWRSGTAAAEAAERRPGRTRLQIAQAVDCADWLPNDLLIKLDRCLMAHGVEGRTPFLDPVVAEVAFRLPDSLKIRKNLGKWLLRRWLERHLPQARPFSKKRGFTVPVAEWISGQGAKLGPLVAAQPGIQEICRPEAVTALFAGSLEKRTGFAAWTLLFYALWHQHHILGITPEGAIFDVLGQA